MERGTMAWTLNLVFIFIAIAALNLSFFRKSLMQGLVLKTKLLSYATLLFGFYMACNIRVNDVNNVMGISVGLEALSLQQLVMIAEALESSGALLIGTHVTSIMQKEIFVASVFQGNDAVLFAELLLSLIVVGTWLQVSVYNGMVESMVGFVLVHRGPGVVLWSLLAKMTSSPPIMGVMVSFIVYKCIKKVTPVCEMTIKLCGQDGTLSCMASYINGNTIFNSIMELVKDVNYYDIKKNGEGSLCFDFSSLEDGIKLFVNSGEYNLIYNWLGNSKWVHAMEWKVGTIDILVKKIWVPAIEVSIYDIVIGDVVSLYIGNQVPTDGILINGHSIAIDESNMIGESKIIHKNFKEPFMMSWYKVADGNGIMLVTSVGINTEWRILMASISEDTSKETPWQVQLNGVATFISIVGLTVSFVVLVVLLARYFIGHSKNPDESVQFITGNLSVSDDAVNLSNSQVHIHWKGAAEIVLSKCFGYIDENDFVVTMDETKMMFFKKAIEDMVAGSLHCVAIAFRSYEMSKVPFGKQELDQWELPQNDFILLATVVSKDLCRPGVKDVVQLCQNVGVKVHMLLVIIFKLPK